MKKIYILCSAFTFMAFCSFFWFYHIQSPTKKHSPVLPYGIFNVSNTQLSGLKWGNWGSRPYEYYWASSIISVANKKVLDLGVGLPSQHNWCQYVKNNLKPAYYVGIDVDNRIKNEQVETDTFKILHMDMSSLSFQDKEFDVAYCISTFEHIPYPIFMKAIKEVYRVLKDDGILVFTLDERWDKDKALSHDSDWNYLEQSLEKLGLIDISQKPFGLPDFLNSIKDYFVPLSNDITVDVVHKTIISQNTGVAYYKRDNKDTTILHSPERYNSCVSYAILKKNKIGNC